MIHPQGPSPGEYRGLSVEEQDKQNQMYREINDWNARALRICEARDSDSCSCADFHGGGDPYCAVHAQDKEHPS